MTASTAAARILVVANRTASTPTLLHQVRESARAGAQFTLLIPPESAHHHGSDWSQEEALRLLGEAAGGEVAVLDCGDDALDTIHRAVDDGRFDEIIVNTVPEHLSRWIHHDLRASDRASRAAGPRDPARGRHVDLRRSRPGPAQSLDARDGPGGRRSALVSALCPSDRRGS